MQTENYNSIPNRGDGVSEISEVEPIDTAEVDKPVKRQNLLVTCT